MKKWVKNTIAIIFAILIILSPIGNYSVKASTLAEQIAELEEKIEQAKKNSSDYSDLVALYQKETELLDQQIAQTQAKIDQLNIEIANIQIKLEAAEKDLQEATSNRELYQQQLDERLKIVYMKGNLNYLDILFGAESFADFIDKIYAIQTMIKYDNEIELKLKAAEALIEEKTVEIAEQKSRLEDKQKEALKEQENLESQLAYKNKKLAEAKENEAYWTALAKQEEAEAAELRRIMASQNSDTNYSNTYKTFIWPIPGHYQITSKFGYRYHPISGIYKLHKGVDIGANLNNEIIAVANGKVILARYYGGYGNCVIIDLGKDTEGNTYKVLYGHMNSIAVSYGDIVTQGQVIGYAGRTGSATGVHLHFEVIINGQVVNPLEYVTK